MLDIEERSAWGKDRRDHSEDDVFAAFYIEAAERLASRAIFIMRSPIGRVPVLSAGTI